MLLEVPCSSATVLFLPGRRDSIGVKGVFRLLSTWVAVVDTYVCQGWGLLVEDEIGEAGRD